jgi:hypothetical protein
VGYSGPQPSASEVTLNAEGLSEIRSYGREAANRALATAEQLTGVADLALE